MGSLSSACPPLPNRNVPCPAGLPVHPQVRLGRVYNLYYGQNSTEAFMAGVKPYLYGYPTEVKMQYDLTSIPTKHYTLGRVAIELVR